VYNINNGHNEGILKGSKTLGAYSLFIATVREYERRVTGRDEAMELVRQGYSVEQIEAKLAASGESSRTETANVGPVKKFV
jgi:hypothetical protein